MESPQTKLQKSLTRQLKKLNYKIEYKNYPKNMNERNMSHV